jgi:hypothetical protein
MNQIQLRAQDDSARGAITTFLLPVWKKNVCWFSGAIRLSESAVIVNSFSTDEADESDWAPCTGRFRTRGNNDFHAPGLEEEWLLVLPKQSGCPNRCNLWMAVSRAGLRRSSPRSVIPKTDHLWTGPRPLFIFSAWRGMLTGTRRSSWVPPCSRSGHRRTCPQMKQMNQIRLRARDDSVRSRSGRRCLLVLRSNRLFESV